MSKQNEHGKLIAAAAKAALLPLDCRRKGKFGFSFNSGEARPFTD